MASSSSPVPPVRGKIAAVNKSSAVESILQTATGGVIVNDPNGLCLVNKGNICKEGNDTGVVTSLTRLAQQLEAGGGGDGDQWIGTVTIETADSAVLIKDYDNHAVALQVPKTNETTMVEGGDVTGPSTTEK